MADAAAQVAPALDVVDPHRLVGARDGGEAPDGVEGHGVGRAALGLQRVHLAGVVGDHLPDDPRLERHPQAQHAHQVRVRLRHHLAGHGRPRRPEGAEVARQHVGGQQLRQKLLGPHADLGGQGGEIHVGLVPQRQQHDHFHRRDLQPGLFEGLLEAGGVLLHELARPLLRRVEGLDDALVGAAEEAGVLGDVVADLVVLGQDAGGVAGHAGDAGLDGPVGPLGVADDGHGALVEPLVVGVDEDVALEAVGQAEDGLAAGVLEVGVAEAGAERVGEEVAAVRQQQFALAEVLRDGVEVVGAPVVAVHGVVPLQHAVVARDAGAEEAGPRHSLLLDVQPDVHAELPLQLREAGRHLEQVVVERGPRGGGHEPVEADDRHARGRVDQHGPRHGTVLEDAVRVVGQDAVPEGGVPEVVAQVDAQDEAVGVDGPGQSDARVPGEAVDELAEAAAVGLEFVGPGAGVGQGGEAEVALEAAAAFVVFFEVGEDPGHDGVVADGGAGNDGPVRGSAGLDPLADQGDVLRRGPRVLAGRRHLAGGDLLVEGRVVGLAGDELMAGDEAFAVEDVVHAALDGAVLAVAAPAVGFEDGVGAAGEVVGRLVGPQRCGRREEEDEGGGTASESGGGHHAVSGGAGGGSQS